MSGIILFGVGNSVDKYEAILSSLNISITAYVDNNPEKWGKLHNGYEIKKPDYLLTSNDKILISNIYVGQITSQLINMKVDDRIIDLSDILSYNNNAINRIGKKNIIIDAFDGIGWGGMEMWSYHVSAGLNKSNHSSFVFGRKDQVKPGEIFEKSIKRFEVYEKSYKEIVDELYCEMEKLLPFTLIDNWSNHALIAACILKKTYPDSIDIISVQHNDNEALYLDKCRWSYMFRKIIGVSKNITNKLHSVYGIESSKIEYKENFILNGHKNNIYLRDDNQPLKIAWGGRLEKIQKRADLIIDLIEKLENEKIKYEFHIAGDGTYTDILKEYINEKSLNAKVILHGFINPGKMKEFWSNKHIYINLSDFEGSSLAMLEAMSQGCVPVVTDVSGANEFVDESNGFRVKENIVSKMADNIAWLYDNESLRQEFAKKSQMIVRKKCDYNDYIKFIENILFK